MNAHSLPGCEADYSFIIKVICRFAIVYLAAHSFFKEQGIKAKVHTMSRLMNGVIKMDYGYQWVTCFKTEIPVVFLYAVCLKNIHLVLFLIVQN